MNDSINQSKYKLAIGELYHPYFHGDDTQWGEDFRKFIYTSYLCSFLIEKDEMFDDDLYPTDMSGPWGLNRERIWPDIAHPYIRNYLNIAKPFRLDIVETLEIESGHLLCIIKTFWLKIFQRKCKKYYKALQARIKYAKNPRVLFYRSITGKQL
jgi:hypothetical protein